ncbi:MAG: AAA family ATPase [Nanoarchaeota archaeon]|nr:AAA family ATPase [Nanoarchaeota archaeon]
MDAIRLQNYRNETEILPGIAMENIVDACLRGRLNLFVVGETGEGKTQLENDILGLFGNKGFFEQGRNDLTIKEMFTRLNLEKLRTAKTSEEVKEFTRHMGCPVYVIDEMTRCIPAVQNQFFNLFDGFITIDGVKYKLGSSGYSIGIASGNIGNGRYVGTSETDRALRDRMHLILDVDYFPKTANDTLEVLAAKSDPRVSDASCDDRTKDIIMLHEKLKQKRPTLLQYIAVMYLVHGLDCYSDHNGSGQSKRKNKNVWPGCVQGHDRGSDASLIFPFSTRAAISALTLAQAFSEIRKENGMPYESSIEPVLDAAYLIGAQSGVLHPSAVDAHYNSNPYTAMNAVVEGVRAEFAAKVDALKEAIKSAKSGRLIHANKFTGRFSYVKDVLERTAMQAKERK